MSSPHQIPLDEDVPPDELVEPPEEEVDPPDELLDPPDDEVEPPEDVLEPPDEDVDPPLLVLLLPPELEAEGSVPEPAPGGTVPFVSVPRSDDGLAKSSLSFAPPQAARRAIDEAPTAQRIRRGFMAVPKH